MALSLRTQKVLQIAMSSKKLADALEALILADGTLSSDDRRNLAIALGDKDNSTVSAVDDIIQAVAASSGTLSLRTKSVIREMMDDRLAADELIAAIES